MKVLLWSLVIAGMMSGVAVADDTSKPNLIFTPDRCMLRITPQDGQLLDGWYICVTEGTYIGTFHESDPVECEQIVEITPHFSIDMSPYLIDCDTAVSVEQIHFGALKSRYR